VSRERGAMSALLLAIAGVVALVAMMTAAVGVLLAEREHAATAAEAAALAAAVATYPLAGGGEPHQAAALYAAANGAHVITCTCDVDDSMKRRTVVVTVGVEADIPLFGEVLVGRTARAEFDPVDWLGR
jgi:hypothetical protein